MTSSKNSERTSAAANRQADASNASSNATAASTMAVLNYLRKMGYRQSEQLFLEEAHVASVDQLVFDLRNEQDANISNYLLFSGKLDSTCDSTKAAMGPPNLSEYETAFDALSNWIYQSLDEYRHELLPVLYPIAVHCFLDMVAKNVELEQRNRFLARLVRDFGEDHEEDLVQLANLNDASQLRENVVAHAFRSSKYNVSMSAYSFRLLMSFLQDNVTPASSLLSSANTNSGGGGENVLLLKIVNQFLNVRVSTAHPSAGASSRDDGVQGLLGIPADQAVSMNRTQIQWGVNPLHPTVEAALTARAKAEGNRLNDIMLHGPLTHLKRSFAQSLVHSPATLIPHPTPSSAETDAEIERLRMLAKRAVLTPSTSTSAAGTTAGSKQTNSGGLMPSICFYTLHNARDAVTSASISSSGSIMLSGSAESFIDVWSLNHEPLRALLPSTELAAMELDELTTSLDSFRETSGSLTKRLVGHSGPVYATAFIEPEGHRLVVSASQDGTVRLWSLDTFTCIAIYRGHHLPVWDVDTAPLGCGPYFCTAGADRTARLWSTAQIQPLRIFAGHLSDVEVVRFHPNGNYVLTGSSDRTIRMWDVQTGACVRLFAGGHSRAISALKCSPDGKFVISGDRGNNLCVWDLAEGKLVRSISLDSSIKSEDASSTAASAAAITNLASHMNNSNMLLAIDFCRDGRMMVTGGTDQIVRVWDAAKICSNSSSSTLDNSHEASFALLASYPTKQTSIFCLHFSTRNVLLATGPQSSN